MTQTETTESFRAPCGAAGLWDPTRDYTVWAFGPCGCERCVDRACGECAPYDATYQQLACGWEDAEEVMSGGA